MRMMLRVTVRVEKGNQAIADGSVPKAIQTVMARVKPEAAYFGLTGGKRTSYMFFDLAEPSAIPELLEPLFMSLNAEIELTPMMTAEDLAKGLGSMPAQG
jgi:hypothetical protein